MNEQKEQEMLDCIFELEGQNRTLKAKLDDYEMVLKSYAMCEPIEIKKEYFNGDFNLYHTMVDIGSTAREILKVWEDK